MINVPKYVSILVLTRCNPAVLFIGPGLCNATVVDSLVSNWEFIVLDNPSDVYIRKCVTTYVPEYLL